MFDDSTLDTALNEVLSTTRQPAALHKQGSGWYSHSVLAMALDRAMPPPWRLCDEPLQASNYDSFLVDNDVLGALVNEANTHLAVLVKHNEQIWYVDSCKTPRAMERPEFLPYQILGIHRSSLKLRSIASYSLEFEFLRPPWNS